MKKILLVLLMFVSLVMNAQVSESGVDKYKALFTSNFIRYIDWSEKNKTGDFVIAVIRDKNMYNELLKFTDGKSFGFQPIVIKHFDGISDIEKCQILYVSNNVYLSKKNILGILEKTKLHQTLFITETESKNNLGMINFIIYNNVLKFEIDIAKIESSGFKISNSLSSMSNAVVK